MRYTAPQIAARYGAHPRTVTRAARSGRLSAKWHQSTRYCDPADPCQLETGTYGRHWSITTEDAEAWLNNTQAPSPAYVAGWQDAVAAITSAGISVPSQLLYPIQGKD